MHNLYIVTCMSVFKFDHLSLDTSVQFVCSSLEKRDSPASTCSQLPILHCIGVRPHYLFPIQIGMFTDVLIVQVMFLQSRCKEFTGVLSEISRRQS